MKIIVGLGNPGEQYKNTRHNIGWLALDYWLGEATWTVSQKFRALLYEQGEYLFVKPQTFMNDSGASIQPILDYYGLRPRRLGFLNRAGSDLNEVLTVIHDDLDLNFGDYRLATDSGSAGHNGVQSLIDRLKTQKFKRLRLGIKNDSLRHPIPPDKFVLSRFSPDEEKQLPELFAKLNLKI